MIYMTVYMQEHWAFLCRWNWLMMMMMLNKTKMLLPPKQVKKFSCCWMCWTWSFLSYGIQHGSVGEGWKWTLILQWLLVQVVYAISLQILQEASHLVAGFSLALDSSTLHGMSYLDVQLWLTFKMNVYNFYLLAIPLFEAHTGENMFSVLVKFMDALYPEWHDILALVQWQGESKGLQFKLAPVHRENLFEFGVVCTS